MKMRAPMLAILTLMLIMLPLMAGCSNGDEAASKAESAAPAETPAAETPAAEAATETAAMHDCAGECGMKAVPEAQMTDVGGKWYCAACATKAQESEDHSGHSHG